MNNDGNVDILVANSADNTVSELLGDGTGAFTVSAGSPFPVSARPSSLAVADFNNDGLLDFVTANSTGNNVSLLLGTATGSFTAASSSPFTTGTAPVSLAVADLNVMANPTWSLPIPRQTTSLFCSTPLPASWSIPPLSPSSLLPATRRPPPSRFR